MIISRTPYRISFFGGGTDYPAWYLKNSGKVLSTTINKYCYITTRELPPFFDHKLRVVYSKIELVRAVKEIQHPSVRETMNFLDMDDGLEIHHDGDLPARSGMGSSSSFTTGLLNALYTHKGLKVDEKKLAKDSIHVEQDLIRETVGSQDQIAAAFGGLNQVLFKRNGDFEVFPVVLPTGRIDELNAHLMLFYTGIKRIASDIAKSYVVDIEEKGELLSRMYDTVDEGIDILKSNMDLCAFGRLLHSAWMLKRRLSAKVTNTRMDRYYECARNSGAIGGKITGAGGGGFLLLFVPLNKQDKVLKALEHLIHVPFNFETAGTKIIFNDQSARNQSGDQPTPVHLHTYKKVKSVFN